MSNTHTFSGVTPAVLAQMRATKRFCVRSPRGRIDRDGQKQDRIRRCRGALRIRRRAGGIEAYNPQEADVDAHALAAGRVFTGDPRGDYGPQICGERKREGPPAGNLSSARPKTEPKSLISGIAGSRRREGEDSGVEIGLFFRDARTFHPTTPQQPSLLEDQRSPGRPNRERGGQGLQFRVAFRAIRWAARLNRARFRTRSSSSASARGAETSPLYHLMSRRTAAARCAAPFLRPGHAARARGA